MQVRETLKNEMDAIIKDLIGKIDVKEDVLEITVNEIFDLAEEQKCFNAKEYRYSEDEETLLNMLVFSIGLSKLSREHKEEKYNATYIYVNYVTIKFLRHMWELEKIPTLMAGKKE